MTKIEPEVPEQAWSKEGDMSSKCKRCRCTEAESLANAKRLGLVEELQNRVYTCCQIAVWFHEQWLAWFDAANEDAKHDSAKTVRAELISSTLLAVLGFSDVLANCLVSRRHMDIEVCRMGLILSGGDSLVCRCAKMSDSVRLLVYSAMFPR